MPNILVSNNSQLLRHLSATALRALALEIEVATSGDEALRIAGERQLDLAILDAEMPGLSGYEVASKLSQASSTCRVVLVLGKRITGAQMQRVASSGCDEVLIAPMSADELYDVVTIQLGLHRHGDHSYAVDVVEIGGDAPRALDAKVSNLSIDGARMFVRDDIAENMQLRVTIRFLDGDEQPLELRARVVWAQAGESRDNDPGADGAGEARPGTLIGASFEDMSAEQRERLAHITQWEIIEETERTRIVIKGDITEAVSFSGLLPSVVGRVSFDMSKVRYMNSLGVREWVEFLNEATAQGYEFHACSVAFTLQASMVMGVLGRGTVISFFAPYVCEQCEHQDEPLLQSATILAADYEPPTLSCPECDGLMELDDIPERYLAFLMPDEALA